MTHDNDASDRDVAQEAGAPKTSRTRQTKAQPLPISDFVAYSPDHNYIYRPTGDPWTSTAANARVKPSKDRPRQEGTCRQRLARPQ